MKGPAEEPNAGNSEIICDRCTAFGKLRQQGKPDSCANQNDGSNKGRD